MLPLLDKLYRDQIRFFSLASVDGAAAQRLLGEAKVVVLNAGAIAAHALLSLADAGIGSLRTVDAAEVTHDDLPGNPLLHADDVGRSRAESLAAHVQRRNPNIQCASVSASPSSPRELALILQGASCALLCLDSPAPALLEAVNQAALKTNTLWIAGQVYGGFGLIGPTVIPWQSPCYRCYELRRNANLDNYRETMDYESRLRHGDGSKTERVAPRPMLACIGAFLALEAMRIITRLSSPQTAGRILYLDFFGPEMTYHRILRFPRCPACGHDSTRTSEDTRLHDRK